jgi:chromosome segregation ATPase
MLDRKTKNQGASSQSTTEKSSAQLASAPTVIELGDLTSGPEAEINRLKAQIVDLNKELSGLRGENQGLKAELREIKIQLSKVQLSEWRGLENVDSWLRSFK